jgi:hypothetical protein
VAKEAKTIHTKNADEEFWDYILHRMQIQAKNSQFELFTDDDSRNLRRKRKGKQVLPGVEQKLQNVSFIRILGDEELSYLRRIFGSAFAIAVKNEKPCPADGVAAVAVQDTDTVGLVVCPSETAELNMNHIRQEQRFQSRIPCGGVDLLYSEDERVFSIVLHFETLQARKEAVMNLSFRRTRGTQQDSTVVKSFLKEYHSLIRMMKVEMLPNHFQMNIWQLKSLLHVQHVFATSCNRQSLIHFVLPLYRCGKDLFDHE